MRSAVEAMKTRPIYPDQIEKGTTIPHITMSSLNFKIAGALDT
jgi:hypothetical protein